MADVDLLPLYRLAPAQLDELAAEHARALPSGLAELGIPMVRRFYSVARDGSDLFGFAAMKDGQLAGAVVGTPNPDAAFDPLVKPLPQFLAYLVRRRPRVLAQMVWSKLKPAHATARAEDSAELMYIFAAPQARGIGVGRRLVGAFLEGASARGLKHVTLSVEDDNQPAIHLYETLGFETRSEGHREGRHVRRRMAKALGEAG